MCRWAAYSGPGIFLDEMISAPGHSLIEQSQAASEAKTSINADGFGVAWYGERETPGIYRDIMPAWSDSNLQSLAQHLRSRLFLAHVRASTGTATSRDNCHPFAFGKWSYMHNGQIGGYFELRRTLESHLSDASYAELCGSTDSELLFRLAIDFGLDHDPHNAFVSAINLVISVAQSKGIKPFVRFTSAFSDGSSLYGVRFATDAHPPSLYVSRPMEGRAFYLVSEPFDSPSHNWRPVEPNQFIQIREEQIKIRDFMPKVVIGINSIAS